MSKAGRFAARDKLRPDKIYDIDPAWQEITTELPRITIGRFVLARPAHPNFGVQETLYDYREALREQNRNKPSIRVTTGDLFVPILSEEDFMRIVIARHPSNQGAAMRKTLYEIRQAKGSIRESMERQRGSDRQRASKKYEAVQGLRAEMKERILDNPDSEQDYDDIDFMHPNDDVGSYELWGETDVGLRAKRTLIDDTSLGFTVRHTTDTVETTRQVEYVLKEAGYGAGLEDLEPHDGLTIKLLETDSPLTSERDQRTPIMYAPPAYIALGPIVLVQDIQIFT